MSRWHADFTHMTFFSKNCDNIIKYYRDAMPIIVPNEEEKKIRLAYRLAIADYMDESRTVIQHDDNTLSAKSSNSVELANDYLWNRLGCPRWFIDRDLADILSRTEIDDDLTGVRWPYDSFHLVFERDTFFSTGIPIRSMSISYPRSDLAQKILKDDLNVNLQTIRRADGGVNLNELLALMVDVGQDTAGNISQETKYDNIVRWEWKRRIETSAVDRGDLNAIEGQTMKEAMKIAVAAVLYWCARPDLVKEYSIPRESRYQFKHREHCRRLTLPTEKIVRHNTPDTVHEGSAKSPHYRGFVLRTLRHERYKRNDDGTLRVVLVPPCAIHPELMETTA